MSASRGQAAALAALWAVASAVALWLRPTISPDETRYLAVAWEMWSRRDFLVPHLNGVPYSDKPPLLFWLMQAGWAVGGVSEFWPRLLGPACALGCSFLLVPLARRLWPDRPQAGWPAALALPGTLAWAIYGSMILFDMLLTAGVLIALLGVLDAWRRGGWRGWLVCGAGLGWALLSKGPVALLHILPVPLLAPWWIRQSRPRWRRWYAGLGLALVVGVAMVLAWAVPAGLTGGPAYRDAIFLRQTADRMVAGAAHGRPLWWYLPVVPAMLLPWALWPGAWRAVAAARRLGGDSGVRLCAAWAAVVFLGFCLIAGKQAHYLLPVMPALALLWGRGWLALRDSAPRSLAGPALLLSGGAAAVLAAPHATALVASQPWTAAVAPWPAALMLLAAGGVWLAGRAGPPDRLPAVVTAAGLAFASLLYPAVMPGLRPAFDVGPVATRLRDWQAAGYAIGHVGRYNGQWHFASRMTEPFTVLADPAEVAAWSATRPRRVVISYAQLSRAAEREAAGEQCSPFRDRLACLAVTDSTQRP